MTSNIWGGGVGLEMCDISYKEELILITRKVYNNGEREEVKVGGDERGLKIPFLLNIIYEQP